MIGLPTAEQVAAFRGAALEAGVTAGTVDKALAAVTDGKVVGVSFSGKLTAGKDSIAEATMQALGHQDAVHEFFARPLKDEVSQMLDVIRREGRFGAHTAAREISEMMNIPLEQAGVMVGALVLDPQLEQLTGWSRTPATRFVCQYHGTEVRRAQDPSYWSKRWLANVVEIMAEGKSVYCTDTRFVNEAEVSHLAFFQVIRLDVSRATQEARLQSRDGLSADVSVLDHPSETGLDDYEGFDLRYLNEIDFDESVNLCVEFMSQSRLHQAA